MADTVRRIDYYYTVVPDQIGAGAKVFNALKAGGVNLIAVNAFPRFLWCAQIDLVPSDRNTFLTTAQKAGIKLVGPKVVFLLQGEDRIGVGADVVGKLEKAQINVIAMQAIATSTGYGAILWVKPRDVDKAAQALGAS